MLANTVKVVFNLVVPEAQDAKSLIAEMSIADCIAFAFTVLSSVNLYDQALLKADEIENVAVERYLPLELHPLKLFPPDRLPEHVFRTRCIASHAAGKAAMVFRRRLMRHSREPLSCKN